jgi:ATP-dependent DNA helicase RecG
MLSLSSSVSELKGVGPEMHLKLKRLGIETVADLINHLPFRYDDFSQISTISNIQPGAQTVKAKIQTISARYARTRGTHVTEAVISDGSGRLKCVWFNQSWRVKSLKSGYDYFFSGDFGIHYGSPVMLNPSVELASDFPANTARILPIYKQTKGLNSKLIRKLQAQIRHLYAEVEDEMPSDLVKLNKLYPKPEALELLHWPEMQNQIAASRLRLAFDEVFMLMMASLINKQENKKLKAPALKFNQQLTEEMLGILPFTLTDDQKKASWQIIKDLQLTEPMNRLVQGDVGSGKTVVALMAAIQCLSSGYQCALIAPTEILATQHFKFFEDVLVKLKFKCHLLTSSTKKSERELINNELEKGPVCLIGTHAVLQKSVKFSSLGLIIIDEQHRFGVKQRQALQARQNEDLLDLRKNSNSSGFDSGEEKVVLSERGQAVASSKEEKLVFTDRVEPEDWKVLRKPSIVVPHLLSLSATPIPRSIMLTVYGELDVSLIQQMPAGRKEVETEIVAPTARARLYAKIDKQIDAGSQVFVVCPLIESEDDSEDLAESELKSVENEYKKLSQGVFKHRKIAMVHGKMKSEQKQEIMVKFKAGKFDILISTTVIEVGVDIPGANVMLIEGAERFGLAQLHQLRGRVGRGTEQAYCYVIPSSDSAIPTRLRYFASVSNGFKLAEYDLKLRGPGQMFGLMQSGNLNLRFADPADAELISLVKNSINLVQKQQIKLSKKMLTRIDQIRKVSILN